MIPNSDVPSALTLPLSVAPVQEVRWGFIGLGARGRGHLNTVLQLKQARVTALCDDHAPSLQEAVALTDKVEVCPTIYGQGPEAWHQLLANQEVDAVVISTAWEDHARMAVAAMKAGKHAFIEVPAAVTLEECWQLVDTAEETGLHCMMLENCNYGREELMVLNMVRQGLFGEVLHCEAAYIHDLRGQMEEVEHGCGSWRTYHYARTQGNPYPTHGVGPLCHSLDVNRGDYFSQIVSMSSPARGRELRAKEKYPADHSWNQIKEWTCGDVNTSLIKLISGKTMMVQWDETSPRPYSRHNYLQGTRGAFGGFPNRIALDYKINELPEALRSLVPQTDGHTDYHKWDTDMEPWYQAYDHPLWRKIGEDAEAHGGHGGMDYIMFWRVQQALVNGLPMDQSVYDAALWSSITPLSRASVEQGSVPIKFPDFTRGKWKSTPPVELIV